MLGHLADWIGIDDVYRLCGFLPAMGLLAWFLPKSRRRAAHAAP
jgi:FSR family fosmidomycin resistance protein-like MFS transporter